VGDGFAHLIFEEMPGERGAHFGVIVDSSQNPTLRRIEKGGARISKGPEGILVRFRRPNVIAR